MKSLAIQLTGAMTALALLSASAAPATARINCKGEFQIIKGQGLVATPYCECNRLAEVARQYGMRVGARAICRNVNLKEDVCEIVGHDNRAHHLCSGFLIEDRGGDLPN